MTVKQYTTSETRKTVTIVKGINGAYTAYEIIPGSKENKVICWAFCLSYVIETTMMYYNPERLEVVF